jgi:hypothetical protein
MLVLNTVVSMVDKWVVLSVALLAYEAVELMVEK